MPPLQFGMHTQQSDCPNCLDFFLCMSLVHPTCHVAQLHNLMKADLMVPLLSCLDERIQQLGFHYDILIYIYIYISPISSPPKGGSHGQIMVITSLKERSNDHDFS